MKNLKRVAVIALAVIMFVPLSAQENGKNGEGRQEWKEKLLMEKIAYLTTKLSLTPEEAQVFWPVYNAASQAKDKAYHQVGKAFKAMEAATEEGKQKEISAAVDNYVKALSTFKTAESDAVAKYRTVLSEEKVAKLIVAEEQFRRIQINRLRQKSQDRNGAPHPREGR